MAGKLERLDGQCPLCSGALSPGLATIPFLVGGTVVVVKDTPAEVCAECDEPFLSGVATDEVLRLLADLQSLQAEVSVVTYPGQASGEKRKTDALTTQLA
jgi:YgiT-type zinc finger domain-containing protein